MSTFSASTDPLGRGILIFLALLIGIPYTRFILRIAIPRWPKTQATVTEVSVGRGLPGTAEGILRFSTVALTISLM